MSDQTENKHFAVCMRVRPGLQFPPGVTKGKCSRCEADVYTAKSTRDLVATGFVAIVCNECVEGVIDGLPEPPIPAIAPGAAQEFAAFQKNAHNN